MILITGGSGFIGSNIAARLDNNGYKIAICDFLGLDDKWKNISKREIADFVYPEEIFDWLDANADSLEVIIHMGAISSTTETDADLIMKNNFLLSSELWNWCSDNNKRFIFASSAATYGDGNEGFKDFSSPEELSKLIPLNKYGWSKHLFDRKIARIIKEKEEAPLQWAGLKFFNVYGPNEYHKGGQKSVIAHIYDSAKANKPFKLFKSNSKEYKDGEQLRDFIWVGDCVDVVMWLIENPKVSGLFNVGTGKARSFNDLAKAVYKALDMQIQIEYKDIPEEISDKYQNFTQADLSKLRLAGYKKAMTELEDGINKYVKGYLKKEDKYI